MEEIITQFAQVFIHYYSNKPSPTSKLFISEPTKNQEEKMGRLFGIFEISTPSRENALIINELINSLQGSYYGYSEDVAKAFENTLEETNQKFNQLLLEKKFPLVGNLNEKTIKEKINFAIGVIKNNKLCLSYLNKIGVFLIHKGKQDYKIIEIKKITPEENEEDTAKLFSNIIIGEINPADYLFLANTNFLNFFSKERITKIITSLPINKAAEYFKNSLLQNEGYNFAAIITRTFIEEQTINEKSASVTSVSELNYTESSTEKLLSPSLLSNFKRSTDRLFTWFNKTKNSFKKQQQNFKEAQGHTVNTQEPITVKQKNTSNNFTKIIKTFTGGFRKILHKLYPQNIASDQKFLKFKNNIRLRFAYLGNYLKRIPNLSKILLISALILIMLFVYSTSYLKQKQGQQVDTLEYQNQVTQIQEKINSAQSSLIYGDEVKAKADITGAQELLAVLPTESQKQRDTNQQLNNDLQTIIAKLRHVTTISDLSLIADLGAEQENNINIKNIIYSNNTLLAFDTINNYVYKINLENREIQKITSNSNDQGKIQKAHRIGDKVLVYQDNNSFLQFNNDQLTPLDVSLSANSKIIDFAFYNNRLYSVDQANNQIFRHPQSPTGFGPGVAWLTGNFDLKNVTTLSIDNNIWLLNDNQVQKFNKGQKFDFTVKDLEPALDKPLELFTNDEANYLYILEPTNKRVVVLDKQGNLKTQYFSQSLENLKTMVINEKEKKMFLVSDNKIYFANLNHF